MALSIGHYPNTRVQLFCFPEIHVDIHDTIKKNLLSGQQLTRDLAIPILKKIQWQSSLFSFLTKPICWIAATGAIVIVGMMLAPIAIGLIALALLIAGVSINPIRNAVSHFLTESLPNLSTAFANQRKKAVEYVKDLEANPHKQIEFENP